MTDDDKTHVILDGLQDPLHAQQLSRLWANAGFENAVDVSGQVGWVRRKEEDVSDKGAAPQAAGRIITEAEVNRAAGMARAFGVELRDRAGKTFVAANDLDSLRGQMVYEYRTRLAQAVMFGLPAIVIHYLAPVLASGGGRSAAAMAYPWLFEMALVGWALWVGGLPILWQGFTSLIHLRATFDLWVTLTVLLAFIPSVFGVVSLLWTSEPWFGAQAQTVGEKSGGPLFHAAMAVMLIAIAQRWLMHRSAARLAGKAQLMMRGCGRLVSVWMVATAVVLIAYGWRDAAAMAIVLPPMLGLGAVNRWSPGWSIALPVIAFAPLPVFGPDALPMLRSAAHLRIEIAACFGVMMTVVFAVGWSRWP